MCYRLLIDIADLDLSGVDVIRGRSLVGVAKHLCGAATDLALRCLLDTLPHQLGRSREQSLSHQHTSGCQALEAAATDGGTQLLGVAMAMCCHHRCTWSALVGQEFLEGCGFSPEEFPLLCQLTSWGVCGVRPPLESGKCCVLGALEAGQGGRCFICLTEVATTPIIGFFPVS